MQIEKSSHLPTVTEVASSVQKSKDASSTERSSDTAELSATGKTLSEIHDIELVKAQLRERVDESEERIEMVRERIKNHHYDQLEFVDQLADQISSIVSPF